MLVAPAGRYRTEGALERFERCTAWPMMGVVIASLLLLVVPLFVVLPTEVAGLFAVLEWTLWVAFLAEFCWRLYIAMDRSTFVRHNLIDLAVVVLPVMPGLRALRLARIGRLMRVGAVGARVVDQSDSIMKRSNAKYAVMVAALIVLIAAAMAWSVEHDNPGSSIHSLADALWWAVTTVATVGYGDKYPITPEGKAVALTLMLLGVAMFGLVSASLASLFVGHDAGDGLGELRADVARLEAKLDRLIGASELVAPPGDSPVASDEASRGSTTEG